MATSRGRSPQDGPNPFSGRDAVKIADLYTDWRVVGGLALVALGAGNWLVGLQRTRQYAAIIAQAAAAPKGASPYERFRELDAQLDVGVLSPFRQRRLSYAAARMDYYHATYMTGQVLVVAGIVLALLGFIGIIKRDALRALDQMRRPPPSEHAASEGGVRRAWFSRL